MPNFQYAVERDISEKVGERPSVLDWIPRTYHPDIRNNACAEDLTEFIQKALDSENTIFVPRGTYNVTQLSISPNQGFMGDSRSECILAGTDPTKFVIVCQPPILSAGYDIDSSLRLSGFSVRSKNGILIGWPDATGTDWAHQGVVKGAIIENVCLLGTYGSGVDSHYESATAVSPGELEALGIGVYLGKAYNWHIRNFDIRSFGIGIKSKGAAVSNVSNGRIWESGRWAAVEHVSNAGEWGDDNTFGPALDLLDNKRVGGILLDGVWRTKILGNFFETYTPAATYLKCVNDIGTQVSLNNITNTQQGTTPIFDLDSRYSCRMENNSFGTSAPIPPVVIGHSYWTYQQPTLWTFVNNSPEFDQVVPDYPQVEIAEYNPYLLQSNNSRDLGGIVAGSWPWITSPSTGRNVVQTTAASLIWKPSIQSRQYRNFNLIVTGRYLGIDGPPQPLNGTGYVVAKYVEGASATTLFDGYCGIRDTVQAQSALISLQGLPAESALSGHFEIELYNVEIEIERVELVPYKPDDPYVLDYDHDKRNLIGNGAVTYPWWITSPVTGRMVLQTTTADIQWRPYIQDRSERSFLITILARKIGSGGSGYTVVDYTEGATTTNLFTGYAGFSLTTEVEAKTIHVTIPASSLADGYFNILLENTEMEIERVTISPSETLPKDTRRGLVAVIGSESDGNLAGIEQVSAAQSGDAEALRMLMPTVANGYAAIGRYTDATTFLEALRIAQDRSLVGTRANTGRVPGSLALTLKNDYSPSNDNNPAVAFWNGVTGTSLYAWVIESVVAGTGAWRLINKSGASETVAIVVDDYGRVSLTGSFGSAWLHLPAASGAGKSPLKFTSGTLLTVPESGSLEFDGADLYFTAGSTRTKLTGQLPSAGGHYDQFLHVNGSTGDLEWAKVGLGNSSSVSISGGAGDFAVRDGGGALECKTFNYIAGLVATYLLGQPSFLASIAIDGGFLSSLKGQLDTHYETQSALAFDVGAILATFNFATEAYVASYVSAHPGPQGPTGPTGPQGPTGPIGPTGP